MAEKIEKLVKTKSGLVFCTFFNHQQDKTLVLLHGNSSSGNFWNPLVESGLRESFNFLVYDLPGHGRSPVPDTPEASYSFPAYAELLVEIISLFELERYVLFGHSLGGHIILESLDRLPACKAAYIMGTPPFTFPLRLELAFQMSPQFLNFMQAGTDRHTMEATFRSMLPAAKGSLADLLIEDYFTTDPQARLLLTQNIQEGKFIDEIRQLRNTPVPVHILCAEEDQLINPAYLEHFFPDREIITLPGLGHYAPLEAPAAFERIIREKSLASGALDQHVG